MTESKESHENPTEPLPWQLKFLNLTERRVIGKIPTASLPSISRTTAEAILAIGKSERRPIHQEGTRTLRPFRARRQVLAI